MLLENANSEAMKTKPNKQRIRISNTNLLLMSYYGDSIPVVKRAEINYETPQKIKMSLMQMSSLPFVL